MGWLAAWGRRKSKTVNGSSAQAVNGYQIGVFVVHKTTGTDTSSGDNHSDQHVYVGTNVRDDFGDVRFTDSDGTTLLTYYLLELDSGVSAKFWVKVDVDQSTSKDIYVYYDKSDATSISVTESSMFWVDGVTGAANAATGLPNYCATYYSTSLFKLPAYHSKSVRITIGSNNNADIILYTGSKSSAGHLHRKYASGTLSCSAPQTVFTDTAEQVEGNANEFYANWQDIGRLQIFWATGGATNRTWAKNANPAICVNTLHAAWRQSCKPRIQIAVRQYVDPDITFGAFGDEEISGSADVIGEFFVRNIGAAALPAGFVVRQWREDLAAELEVGQGAEGLPSEFEVGQGSEDLPASFEGQASLSLPGEFIVSRPGSVNLPAEFIVRHADAEDLPGELVVRQPGSAELLGEFAVRRAATPLNLPAEFIVRHSTSQELLGELIVRHPALQELLGKFVVSLPGSAELLAEFLVRHPGSVELLGEFEIRRSSSQELLSKFIVRQAAAVELLGELVVRQEASAELLGEFLVTHPGSVELLGEFEIRRSSSQELLSKFIVRQAAAEDLPGELIVRQPGSAELLGEFAVRRTATPLNLPAEFIVRQPDSAELAAKFIVRRAGSQELGSSFEIRLPFERLFCKFYVRPLSSTATDFTIIDNRRVLTVIDTDREMAVSPPRRRMKIK